MNAAQFRRFRKDLLANPPAGTYNLVERQNFAFRDSKLTKTNCDFCALGVLGYKAGIALQNMEWMDTEEYDVLLYPRLKKVYGIDKALGELIHEMNDEYGEYSEPGWEGSPDDADPLCRAIWIIETVRHELHSRGIKV